MRYIDRYFRPTLKKLPSQMYDYNRQSKEMRICDTLIDFRSADRAENIEGFGYHKIILNEAGIILKGERGRYIWENAMLPMTMDYECTVFMGGTPKGIVDKTGKETIYYRLFQRASGNSPNWSTINVTTDENPYLNETSVREVQDELPEGPVRDQEFYGKFVQGGATVINPDLFQIVDAPLVGRAVRYWDMAVSVKKSADYSAGAKVCADATTPWGTTDFDDWLVHQEQWVYVQVPRFGLVSLQDVTDVGSPANRAWRSVGAPTTLYEPIAMHAPVANTNNGAIVVLMLPERCLGDFNMDGRVDLYDAGPFAAAFVAMDLSADLTGDLRVDVHDQFLFLLLATMPCVNTW